MDDQSKKLVEETQKSEYFDFIVEAKIKSKIGEMLRRYRWLFGLLLLLNLIILILFGYEAVNLRQEVRVAEEKSRKADELIGEAENFLANIEKTEEKFEKIMGFKQEFLDMQDEIISDRKKYNEDAKADLEERMKEIRDLQLTKQSEELDKKLKEIELKQQKTRDYLAKLETYKQTIAPEIERLSQTSSELKKIASVRYIYVERGDKAETGDEFRPVIATLPFSKDVLDVRFHTQKKENNVKKVWVDVLLGDSLLFEDLQWTDREHINRQIKAEFISSEGHTYKIDPVFIYLPPNPLYTIPDYVILKVQLISLGKTDRADRAS